MGSRSQNAIDFCFIFEIVALYLDINYSACDLMSPVRPPNLTLGQFRGCKEYFNTFQYIAVPSVSVLTQVDKRGPWTGGAWSVGKCVSQPPVDAQCSHFSAPQDVMQCGLLCGCRRERPPMLCCDYGKQLLTANMAPVALQTAPAS
jgi:hypothetical protein